MRIKQFVISGVVFCAMGAGGAYAQTAGDEIVIPSGAFVKDFPGLVKESGGYSGTGKQHGALRFPPDLDAVVGITTLLPESWVGHDIDIVFGGSTGGMATGQFRIQGIVEDTTIAVTTTLMAEDDGTSEVVVVNDYEVPGRRFGIAIGRDPDHSGDTWSGQMNFEYLVLIFVN